MDFTTLASIEDIASAIKQQWDHYCAYEHPLRIRRVAGDGIQWAVYDPDGGFLGVVFLRQIGDQEYEIIPKKDQLGFSAYRHSWDDIVQIAYQVAVEISKIVEVLPATTKLITTGPDTLDKALDWRDEQRASGHKVTLKETAERFGFSLSAVEKRSAERRNKRVQENARK